MQELMGVNTGGGVYPSKIKVGDGLYYHSPNIFREEKKIPKIDIV